MSAETTSTAEARPARSSNVDVIAAWLASLAIFSALISLAWHPIRLLAPALLLAIISAGMSGRGKRLPFLAMMTVAACFFLGMMITVITGRALW